MSTPPPPPPLSKIYLNLRVSYALKLDLICDYPLIIQSLIYILTYKMRTKKYKTKNFRLIVLFKSVVIGLLHECNMIRKRKAHDKRASSSYIPPLDTVLYYVVKKVGYFDTTYKI